ncbi:MAG TPA: hypothetical protein IAC14_02480 [Candidatus Scybalomonas excrementigallinarum]|uniref:Uncharacterized protein n=1 Tax=Candidatus Scybalomonas excrementavium TaxID=2840943 RepID=A0A9D9I065_9FIRM|nr:hypothetical protein [Candidatus Scybalomonas excrementavium]HIS61107.1 hypothetical protein [Candidatus Scybalomonas excrementigallinarum]
MLAAHEMGSGTCWIGFEEYMRNTKEVPSPKRKNRLFLRNLYKDKEDILFMTKTS